MWLTANRNGISARYLDRVGAAGILDINNKADESNSAKHNGRELKKKANIFSKASSWLKQLKKSSTGKGALRIENITWPLGNTAKNPVAKVDTAISDSAVQTEIEAAANAKLAFETSVMVINKRLDDIGASIDELARPRARAEPAPELMATAIDDLSAVQDFMKHQAEYFMQIAHAGSPMPELMENDEASADVRKVSGQPSANAVVKFDKFAMRAMLKSIRADMRNVFIAEAKAKPDDKELYMFLVEGLHAGLNKTRVSMEAVVEEAVKYSEQPRSNSDGETIRQPQEAVDHSDYDTVNPSRPTIYQVDVPNPMYTAIRNWIFSMPSDTSDGNYDTVKFPSRPIYQEPIYEEIREPLFSIPIDDTSKYEMPPPLPPRNRVPPSSNTD